MQGIRTRDDVAAVIDITPVESAEDLAWPV